MTTSSPARYLALRRTNGAVELWTEGDLTPGYGYGGPGAPRRPHGDYLRNPATGGYDRVAPSAEALAAYEAACAAYVNPVPPERRELSFASGPTKVGNLARRLRRPPAAVAVRLVELDAQIAALQAERSALIATAWADGEPLDVATICTLIEADESVKGPTRRAVESRLAPVSDQAAGNRVGA